MIIKIKLYIYMYNKPIQQSKIKNKITETNNKYQLDINKYKTNIYIYI